MAKFSKSGSEKAPAATPSELPWPDFHFPGEVGRTFLDSDFTQANDLAAADPEKLRQLQDLWSVEAAKYNVLPPFAFSGKIQKVTVELKAK